MGTVLCFMTQSQKSGSTPPSASVSNQSPRQGCIRKGAPPHRKSVKELQTCSVGISNRDSNQIIYTSLEINGVEHSHIDL
jgi:hypothetical protein